MMARAKAIALGGLALLLGCSRGETRASLPLAIPEAPKASANRPQLPSCREVEAPSVWIEKVDFEEHRSVDFAVDPHRGLAAAWVVGDGIAFAWEDGAAGVKRAQWPANLKVDKPTAYPYGPVPRAKQPAPRRMQYPSLAWHPGGLAAAWFDGDSARVAEVRAPEPIEPVTLDLHAAPQVRPQGNRLAVAWNVGRDVRAQALDTATLALVGNVASAKEVGSFNAARGGDSLELLGLRQIPCGVVARCQEATMIALGKTGDFGALLPLLPPQRYMGMDESFPAPLRTGTRLTALLPISGSSKVAVVDGGRLHILPAPAGVNEGYPSALAAGPPGVAIGVTQSYGRENEERLALVFLQDWRGLPVCRYRLVDAGRQVLNLALKAHAEGVEMFWFSQRVAPAEPAPDVRRARIAWSPVAPPTSGPGGKMKP